MKAALIMGSKNDYDLVAPALEVFQKFGVSCTVRVLSAHRTPAQTAEFAQNARKNGIGVIICAAGMAAHLAGAVAGQTALPVIGLPLKAGALAGMDALLATVQMPPGVPVATVGVNAAKNAALLAVQMLSLADAALYEKLEAYKKEMAEAVLLADAKIGTEE